MAMKLKNDMIQLQQNLSFKNKQKNVIPPIFRAVKTVRKNEQLIEVDQDQEPGVKKRRNRSKKQVTRCPHTDMKHYAKGMCNHCYHLYGRSSLATKCPHKDKMIYAKGMC